MNWFPQIGSGSVAQFPLSVSRQWRAIRNELESGEQILFPDPAATRIQWNLPFKDLNDSETAALTGLFSACRGSYGQFGFIDPLANLLGWTADLSKPDWQAGLISATPGAVDPTGASGAWTLTNGAAGDQQLTQTLAVPGEYTSCFSLWVRSASGGSVLLQRDSVQIRIALTAVWKRVFVSGAGAAGATNATYSIGLGAAQSVQIYAPQVEAQPYPSQYKETAAASGIYEETWFAEDELKVIATAPGLFSCDVKLLSRV